MKKGGERYGQEERMEEEKWKGRERGRGEKEETGTKIQDN